MTKFCSSCHTENRDSARFCRGCTGKFSGIKTPATAFDSTRRDAVLVDAPPETGKISALAAHPQRPSGPRRRWLPALAGMDVSVLWLVLALAVLQGSFVLWYWTRPSPSRSLENSPRTKDESPADYASLAAAPVLQFTPAPSVQPQFSTAAEPRSAVSPAAPTTAPGAIPDIPPVRSAMFDALAMSGIEPSSSERPAPSERSSPNPRVRVVESREPAEPPARSQTARPERAAAVREERLHPQRPPTPPASRSPVPTIQDPELSRGCDARASGLCRAPSSSAQAAPAAVSANSAPPLAGAAAVTNNPLYKVFDALRTLGTAIAPGGHSAEGQGASGGDGGTGAPAGGLGSDAAGASAAGSSSGSTGGGGSGGGGAGGGGSGGGR